MQDENKNNRIVIYSDGSCTNGNGGWGAVIFLDNIEIEISDGETKSTNNRMELMAVIKGLEYLPDPSKVSVYSDSTYVINGMSQWIENWKNQNWKTSSKQPVKNKDLWERLDAVARIHDIQWIWVKGHSTDLNNKRVDKLAGLAAKRLTESIKVINL